MKLLHPAPGFAIGSRFGPRPHPFGDRGPDGRVLVNHHNGVDVRTPVGTPLRAPSSGVVVFAGALARSPSSGIALGVDADDGRTRWSFAHLSAVFARVGARVSAGDVVALSGATGTRADGSPAVTGPHLHFRVDVDGVPVDPEPLLAGRTSIVAVLAVAFVAHQLVRLLAAYLSRPRAP